MTIAVNTRFLSGKLEGYGYYIREIFSRISRSNPQHRFIFIFDRKPDEEIGWPPNVFTEVLGPPARHPILWKWWYDFRLPRRLKKIGADLFVSPDGFCSTRTGVPQLLVIHDLDFIHHPGFNRRSHIYYYRRYIPRCIAKASKLITVSEYSKKEIIQHYPSASGKIERIYNGVSDRFKPLSFEKKNEIRARFTEGREYFLYAGAIHPRKNLMNLLKGFSLFKRRQQSSMKLVIAGRQAWMAAPLVESLKTYKYREDVILTGYLDEQELPLLMAGAYAFVYPSLMEGFGLPVLESMACGVPAITSENSAMQEIANDAAVYVDPNDPASIASEMMHLYKDEDFRAVLSARGLKRAPEFDWEKAAARFWQVILEAAGPNP
jgi:glycosyltransferase involved in cell wall biosynthesis